MMGEVISATRESFREQVADGLVLVDVWGPSCRPCLALMPHVERLASQREELRVVKLEAPKARRLCIELRVHGLPSFLLLRDGRELGRLSAPTISPRQLEQWLDATLAGGEQQDHESSREEVSR
jgi:thioredoxin-like negative regulator of GroEL